MSTMKKTTYKEKILKMEMHFIDYTRSIFFSVVAAEHDFDDASIVKRAYNS